VPNALPDALPDQEPTDEIIDGPLESEIDDSPEEPEIGFAELGLPKPLVSALARQGLNRPFAIQRACVPDALAGRDVLGRGQTGSGKTLAFGLPMLTRVAGGPARPRKPRGLVLVPTRELAMQVHDALEPLGRGLSVRMKTVVGGTSMPKQIAALRRGVEILVATPGRLLDLIERGACDLGDISVTVVDEADLMADMGFLPDITKILDKVPSGQRMLFSATLDGDVDTIVRTYLTDPVTHALAPPSASVTTMDHQLLMVQPKDKLTVTAEIANRKGRTIMFVRTKHGADRLVGQLNAVGVRAAALHGGKTQAMRTRTLAEFREGKIGALVATDVAARGIHVDNISLVLHVDPPVDHKDYLHRAGRTARAGETGTVATLVLPHQVRAASRIAQRAGVRPGKTRVAAGDDILNRLTGALPPSGVPVPPPVKERPSGGGRRPRDAGAGKFGGRPQQRRRHPDAAHGRGPRPAGRRDARTAYTQEH
jgi:superfamily II DNA/RNA helicase